MVGLYKLSGDSLETLFGKARNSCLNYQTRAAAMHELMDIAEAGGDESLWMRIAGLLVEAFELDDVSAKVSDHFVEKSPDPAFEHACRRVIPRYAAWRRRAKKFQYRR